MVALKRHRSSDRLGDILSQPSVKEQSDYVIDVFVVCAPDQAEHAEKIKSTLEAKGISVFVPVVNKVMNGSAEALHISANAKISASALVLVSQELLRNIVSRSVADVTCKLFNICKRIPTVCVAVTEASLLDPLCWGWNAVFAHLSGVTIWDLSLEIDSQKWIENVHGIGAQLKPTHAAGQLQRKHTQLDTESLATLNITPCNNSSPASPAEKRRSSRRLPTSGSELGKRLPHWMQEHKEAVAFSRKMYDAFLSHNWGFDAAGRDNHERVHLIARYLRKNGLQVFMDVWEMHHYDSIDQAMVEGLKNSKVSVIFITETYLKKIKTGGHWDNCVAEYNLSKKCPGMIPVVMEPQLKSPNAWGWNAVNAELSNKLYIDCITNSSSWWKSALTVGWSTDSQRWSCSLNALHQRILSDSSKQRRDAIVVNQSSPFVPHQLRVSLFGGTLFVASLIKTLLLFFAFGAVEIAEEWAMEIFADLLFAISFHAFMQWFFLLAREPPDFDFSLAKLPKLQAISSFLRMSAAILGFLEGLRKAYADEDGLAGSTEKGMGKKVWGDLNVFSAWQVAAYLVANSMAVADMFLASRHSPWGFDASHIWRFSNLPCWSAVCLLLGSLMFAVPQNFKVKNRDGWLVVSNIMNLISSVITLCWVHFAPKKTIEYYRKIRLTHSKDAPQSGEDSGIAGPSAADEEIWKEDELEEEIMTKQEKGEKIDVVMDEAPVVTSEI